MKYKSSWDNTNDIFLTIVIPFTYINTNNETVDLIGKPSLAEHKIYKSGRYDLIKMKKKKNSTSWDA